MWSPQQEVALKKVSDWLRSKDKPFFRLDGWAGTGKTTLAKHLAQGVEGRVYFAAFTGKAAHVLQKSGAPNVSTIHKLIYKPKDKSKEKLLQLRRELAELRTQNPLPATLIDRVQKAIADEEDNLTRPMFALDHDSPLKGAALLVIDEHSMVSDFMGRDLTSFGVPILALGDPGQLPPVNAKPFFTGAPDFALTEIHRQAADNPIIWMSREIREGRGLKPGTYGESTVTPIGRLGADGVRAKVLGSDQLLVGKNATRQASNARCRELRHAKAPIPVVGDKLVCLRNNSELGLLNGQIWTASSDAQMSGSFLLLDLVGEDGERLSEVSVHPEYFHGGKPSPWTMKDAQEFDYGYALTVHKSQGSQWNDVTLFDEWYRDDRRQWLYTGVTRAAERIDIVQM